jgi:1-phosphofructokinase/tagatose 6-phosphate kinase
MPERPADVDAMLHVIRARGVGIAVVTDGAAGSYALGVDGRRMHAVSTAPPGRYSVGSGDSYLAGLVAALDDGADLADALRLATACGVANTRVPGAGVLTADAIAEERQRVRVDDVDGEQK